MTTITKKLAALVVVAATLIATGNADAGGRGGGSGGGNGGYHPKGPGGIVNTIHPIVYHPVHGQGSSHNPIVNPPPVHGPGSSHNPIVCVPGARPGSLDCRHQGQAR